jgi:hypothetical protein
MRNATWVAAAVAMFSCAQGAPAEDPPLQGAASAVPASPAGNQGPCDRNVDAQVAVVDSGACRGIMPPASRCAADIVICNGVSAGPEGGLVGSFAAAATADGRGSLVLSCARADVGPAFFNFLFVPHSGGFVSKAPLGVDVRPLRDGFLVSDGSYILPPPSYDFLAHDGTLRASQNGGTLYAGPDGAVIVRPVEGQLIADSYAADGSRKATAVVATYSTADGVPMLGGAMNTAGATLILWQVYGERSANARWLAADGSIASAAFSIAGWTDTTPVSAPLAGGGIAIAAQPPSGTNARQWRGIVAPEDVTEQPAPSWLQSRGEFFLLPAGKAMAFGNEIVGPDGTVCGTVDVGAPLVGIGVDGTAFSARDQRTFRVHPQLFR